MLKDLIKIATTLDSMGLAKEADQIDLLIKSAADWGGWDVYRDLPEETVKKMRDHIGSAKGKLSYGLQTLSIILYENLNKCPESKFGDREDLQAIGDTIKSAMVTAINGDFRGASKICHDEGQRLRNIRNKILIPDLKKDPYYVHTNYPAESESGNIVYNLSSAASSFEQAADLVESGDTISQEYLEEKKLYYKKTLTWNYSRRY